MIQHLQYTLSLFIFQIQGLNLNNVNWTFWIMFVTGAMIMFAGGVSLILLWPMLVAKYRVLVLVEHGEQTIKALWTWGRITKQDGVEKLYLPAFKKHIEPPTNDNTFYFGRNKDLYIAYRDRHGNFHPMIFKLDAKEENIIEMHPFPKNVQFWAMQELKRAWEIYQKPTWIERYAGYMVIALVSVVTMIIIIYTLNQLKVVASSISALASAVASL